MISPPLVDCIAEIAATERGEHSPGALMGAADWCVELALVLAGVLPKHVPPIGGKC